MLGETEGSRLPSDSDLAVSADPVVVAGGDSSGRMSSGEFSGGGLAMRPAYFHKREVPNSCC